MVGASIAGLRFVESARRQGYDGRIRLVGAEEHLPYDRPPLSKSVLKGEVASESTQFKDHGYFRDLDVDLELGSPAISLDLSSRKVHLANGKQLGYTKMLIATGSQARQLPGVDLEGLHTLRTLDDAVRIREAMEKNPKVVVIGSGFVGSEVAASARSRGLDVTVVEALSDPLVRILGPELGPRFSRIHRDNGTVVHCQTGVESVEGRDRVEAVRLSDGRVIEADLVICGIGARPSTDWLEGSGLPIKDGILANSHLQVTPEIYAAGDVVRWDHALFGKDIRIEHWTNAAEQGAAAAQNMLGLRESSPYIGVPYFWSDWYNDRVQFAGIPSPDYEIVLGDLNSDRFVAVYREQDRIVGAVSLNWPTMIMKFKALIGRGGTPQEGKTLARSAA